MSFKNRYRETLKEDAARMHFFDHELVCSPSHRNARRFRAVKRDLPQEIVNVRYLLPKKEADHQTPWLIQQWMKLHERETEERLAHFEEELFQEWYKSKQESGFAQFPHDSFDPEED